MNHDNKMPLIAILLCIPILGIGIDLYTPALPNITYFFNTTTYMTKTSISIFILGAFVAMPIFGSMSDIYGRRKIVIYSLIVNSLSNICILFSKDIIIFLIFRFVSGAALGAVGATIRAIITDLYIGANLKKTSTLITTSWAMGPIIAPFVGGAIQQYFGWKIIFILLAFYSALCSILVLKYIPESKPKETRIVYRNVLQNYITIIKNTYFLATIMICGLLYASLTYFGLIGSIYIQNKLGYSSISFGRLALIVGFAYLTGTILSRLLFRYIEKNMNILFIIVLLTNIICLICSYITNLSLAILLFNTIIISIILGMIYALFFSASLAIFPNAAGSAGALASTFIMLIVSITSFIASSITIQNIATFIFIYFITLLIAYLINIYQKNSPSKVCL